MLIVWSFFVHMKKMTWTIRTLKEKQGSVRLEHNNVKVQVIEEDGARVALMVSEWILLIDIFRKFTFTQNVLAYCMLPLQLNLCSRQWHRYFALDNDRDICRSFIQASDGCFFYNKSDKGNLYYCKAELTRIDIISERQWGRIQIVLSLLPLCQD